MSTIRTESPHSRACGFAAHEHGSACHSNCPTCHGVALPAETLHARTVTKAERETLKRAIYAKIAYQGGDEDHYQAVRGGMYDEATDAALAALGIEVRDE